MKKVMLLLCAQILGFDVDAINSVQFSNHTGNISNHTGNVLVFLLYKLFLVPGSKYEK